MYARIHALLLLLCGLYIPYYCPYIWPMYAPMYTSLLLLCGLYIPYYYPYIWPIYARIYAPLSGTKIRTIRKAIKKRQTLYLIWTSLLALAIYSI